jgi:hypothetical protein
MSAPPSRTTKRIEAPRVAVERYLNDLGKALASHQATRYERTGGSVQAQGQGLRAWRSSSNDGLRKTYLVFAAMARCGRASGNLERRAAGREDQAPAVAAALRPSRSAACFLQNSALLDQVGVGLVQTRAACSSPARIVSVGAASAGSMPRSRRRSRCSSPSMILLGRPFGMQ